MHLRHLGISYCPVRGGVEDKIAGKNKDKVMSEMVLSLYDGSLDAFKNTIIILISITHTMHI